MPATLDPLGIDAAALQGLTRRDMLQELLRAKAESDRYNYAAKAEILRKLLRSNGGEFRIDSEANGIAGLTHDPTNFRIHLPSTAIPAGVTLRRTKQAYAPDWDVGSALEELAQEHGDAVLAMKEAASKHAAPVWYNPDKDELWVKEGAPPGLYDEPWVLIKDAYSPTLRGVTDLASITPGPANKWYGGPRPLASMLLGGVAGAGLGYLGGAVGEGLLGDRLEKGRLKTTLALLGGSLGALPGALGTYSNVVRKGPMGVLAPWQASEDQSPSPDANNPHYVQWDAPPYKEAALALRKLLPDCLPSGEFRKAAFAGGTDPDLPPIDVDAFGRVIWSAQDPFTPSSIRAGASGLLDGASMMRSGSSLVTPADVGRVALGMGSGYVAGRLVGKTLGVLAGLDPESQSALQRAGTWAGVLKTVVPMAFGPR